MESVVFKELPGAGNVHDIGFGLDIVREGGKR